MVASSCAVNIAVWKTSWCGISLSLTRSSFFFFVQLKRKIYSCRWCWYENSIWKSCVLWHARPNNVGIETIEMAKNDYRHVRALLLLLSKLKLFLKCAGTEAHRDTEWVSVCVFELSVNRNFGFQTQCRLQLRFPKADYP